MYTFCIMTNEQPKHLTSVEQSQDPKRSLMNQLADEQIEQRRIIKNKQTELEVVKGGDPSLTALITQDIENAQKKLDEATNKLRPLLQEESRRLAEKFPNVNNQGGAWGAIGATGGNTRKDLGQSQEGAGFGGR